MQYVCIIVCSVYVQGVCMFCVFGVYVCGGVVVVSVSCMRVTGVYMLCV